MFEIVQSTTGIVLSQRHYTLQLLEGVGTPSLMTRGMHLYPDRPWPYPPKRTRGAHLYPGPPGRSTRHSQASCPDGNISYPDILSRSLTIASMPC